MKLWLHFTNILEAHRSEDNKMEVADVQISDPESQKEQPSALYVRILDSNY